MDICNAPTEADEHILRVSSTAHGHTSPHNTAIRGAREAQVALLHLLRDVGRSSDLKPLLRRIEATALRILGCERLTIFTNEPSTNELHSRYATGTPEIHTPSDRGIAAATLREGRMINVHDVTGDPRFYSGIDRQTGYRTRSLLSVPLHGVGSEITGVLELLNKSGGTFTPSDEELALTLGSLTEITLQRHGLVDQYREKQRLEHDLELARTIQRSLLPSDDPSLAGYEISAWSRAADATGGDFYDYFPLPDGRLGLVVADVAGHGLAASLLACETRALIRSAAASGGSLVEIVRSANDLLYHDLRHERFVVLFLGALDAETGRLEFVGAGGLTFVCQSGKVRSVEATIPPLALFPDVPAAAVTEVTLRPEDMVVLATDGFYEWENWSGDQYGLGRLCEQIRANALRSPGELIRSIYRDVSSYGQGVKQVDDLTAMVIRRTHS
jgi:phosphoserine phosphatase